MSTAVCPFCSAVQDLAGRNLAQVFECSGCRAVLRPFVEAGGQERVVRLLKAISSVSRTAPEDLGFGPEFLRKYRPFKKLGEGTMGAVHKCVETATGRKVAVKVLLFEGSPELTERFMQEGHILAKLDHQHIVKLVDVGHESVRHYMVFELVDGHSIREEVDRNGLLPEKRALEIVRQVLRGLEHAHGLGIVHRDIKPENVLLTKFGYVKIADFGLAKSASMGLDELPAPPQNPAAAPAPVAAPGGTRSTLQVSSVVHSSLTETDSARKTCQPTEQHSGRGAIVGTPAYMAPEQAQGLEVNHLADIYSTGIMLWELLAGRPPFPEDDIIQVLEKQIRELPPAVNVANPRVPSFLDGLVQWAIAKSPADRYQSAAEFGHAVDEAIERLERLTSSGIVRAASRPLASVRPTEPAPTAGGGWIALIVAVLALLALLAAF